MREPPGHFDQTLIKIEEKKKRPIFFSTIYPQISANLFDTDRPTDQPTCTSAMSIVVTWAVYTLTTTSMNVLVPSTSSRPIAVRGAMR